MISSATARSLEPNPDHERAIGGNAAMDAAEVTLPGGLGQLGRFGASVAGSQSLQQELGRSAGRNHRRVCAVAQNEPEVADCGR